MAIRLIAETERLTLTLGDAQIHYRRVPSHVQKQLEARHTKRGLPDARAIVDDVLAYAVQGWTGVQDSEGQPVAFAPELLKFLPEQTRADIVSHLYESDPGEHALKN